MKGGHPKYDNLSTSSQSNAHQYHINVHQGPKYLSDRTRIADTTWAVLKQWAMKDDYH